MNTFNISLLIISTLLVFSGLFIIKIQAYYFNEPLIAMIIGLSLGPAFIHLVDIENISESEGLMQTATKLTIALSLVATALKVPSHYINKFRRDQALILSGGMLLMWIFSALIAFFIFDLQFSLALLLGAVITPTDPVVSSTIVSGKFAEKYLPSKIRNTISFESGANDGLAYPIVLACLFMLGQSDLKSWGDWFFTVILWENVVSICIGLLFGYCFGALLNYADKKHYMIPKTLLPFTITSTFLALSFLELIHCNSISGIFAFGIILRRQISKNERLEEEKIQESMERLFTIPVFFLLGLILPIQEWQAIGFPILLLFGCCILLFRRMPAMLLLLPLFKHFTKIKDVSLLGWYGPIGVAAIFYSMHVLHLTPYHSVWIYSSFIIFVSTIVHGLSSLPIAKWYDQHTQN